MNRVLQNYILSDLTTGKIILITGPRQCGKTTLSKGLMPVFDYLNYDNSEHRLTIKEKSWDRSKPLLILDELHKLKHWKKWLKGIWDVEEQKPAMVVTGSAKLNVYKKMGDSLAGRFFQYRLHPFDIKEIIQNNPTAKSDIVFTKLLEIGGFPEPYKNGNKSFYNKWARSHLDIIIRQDIIELENIKHINALETLVQLLRQRVSSPVSYSSLANDLQYNDKTIKRWLKVLEDMYIIFKVPVYHKNIARSLIKSAKYYFYDTGQVLGEGAKLENLVACSLLKELHFREDCLGEENHYLYYLRNKEGAEIDFFVTQLNKPKLLLEVKWADDNLHPCFKTYEKYLPQAKKIQLVANTNREKTFPNGVEIRQAAHWLSKMDF